MLLNLNLLEPGLVEDSYDPLRGRHRKGPGPSAGGLGSHDPVRDRRRALRGARGREADPVTDTGLGGVLEGGRVGKRVVVPGARQRNQPDVIERSPHLPALSTSIT